jgi:C4-dicarboxylate-specific signal transduction histidine kinase
MWQTIVIAAAILLQSAVIGLLLLEFRRRRSAEAHARHTLSELANLNQVATAREFSASLAHEVNQPLAAMVANANAGLRFLAASTPDIEETRAALKSVVSDGHRAGDVIQNVRTTLKKDDQDKAWLDLNEIVRDVLNVLHGELRARHIRLQTGLHERLPPLMGHRLQLQQVILNLVRNAAEAMGSMPPDARILRVKSDIQPLDQVLVSIADNGTGIDPKDIERIFQPLVTTKPHRVGMGLTVSRSIIEAHSGRLWASTDTNYGSVFHIALPAGKPGT